MSPAGRAIPTFWARHPAPLWYLFVFGWMKTVACCANSATAGSAGSSLWSRTCPRAVVEPRQEPCERRITGLPGELECDKVADAARQTRRMVNEGVFTVAAGENHTAANRMSNGLPFIQPHGSSRPQQGRHLRHGGIP